MSCQLVDVDCTLLVTVVHALFLHFSSLLWGKVGKVGLSDNLIRTLKRDYHHFPYYEWPWWQILHFQKHPSKKRLYCIGHILLYLPISSYIQQ